MTPGHVCAQHDTTAPERTPGDHDNTRSNHEDPGHPRRVRSPIDRGTRTCQRRTGFQRRASLPCARLRTPRWSNTKALEMLPPSACLSHEESMSPKSGNQTRPCTCARSFRRRRPWDNTRTKHTPCTVECTLGKRAQNQELHRSLSPPRCRSGDRPYREARHLVRPSDCRARHERRVGAFRHIALRTTSKSPGRVFTRSVGQAGNTNYE